MGVTFRRIPGLTNGHLGAFWAELRSTWPHVQDAYLSQRQIEQFDDKWLGAGAELRVSQNPAARLVISNSDCSRAIQMQQNAFDYSWIRTGSEIYPRYGVVREGFDQEWARFCQFLRAGTFSDPDLLQWEITYVNEIPKGDLWRTPEDWPSLFSSSFGVPSQSTLANLESFNTNWHFQIPEQRGRLHVRVTHAHRGENTVLVLTLTARGPVDAESDFTLSKGLDLGRESIVNSFKQITSPKAHQHWRIES